MPLLQTHELVEPVTVKDLIDLSRVVALSSLPTLHSGWTADLKFDNGHLRMWLSRMTLKDFVDGKENYEEGRAAWARDSRVIEELVDGQWVRRCCACPDSACHDEKKPYIYGGQ